MKKFALLTVVAALFAAPAFARQSMNMTGMENTVGVLSSYRIRCLFGSAPIRNASGEILATVVLFHDVRQPTPAAGAAIKVFLRKCKSAMS